MPPTNTAVWLPSKRIKPLQVGPAPYTPPDWVKQLLGDLLLSYIKYPCILGDDVAGEVVEIGPSVTRFKVGDRVLGLAAGTAPFGNRHAEGAFQEYTILREFLAAPIPEWMGYEEASVLPLCLTTAAYGLFHHDFLGLDLPTVPAPQPTKAIIVTGGASSVGSNAIQLAVSAGYTVISTSSPKNFAYVKNLGASHVFDYHSKTLVDDITAALDGKTVAGAYAIGDGAVEACMQVLRRCGPRTSKRFIAFAGALLDAEKVRTSFGQMTFAIGMAYWFANTGLVGWWRGIGVKFIDTKELGEEDGVVAKVYKEFLPQALETRQFVPAPEPMLVGEGLEKVQVGMDVQMGGVSARKVVVSL